MNRFILVLMIFLNVGCATQQNTFDMCVLIGKLPKETATVHKCPEIQKELARR